MKYIRGFLMAWGNFSAVPCPYHKWHEESRKAMLAMLPLVGLMLAVIVCVAWWLLDLGSMNSIFTGVAITAIYFYCNGFIHMDGFMDCSDAILSRRPELEERQRILKASDVGAFAVISLVFMTMVFAASMITLAESFSLQKMALLIVIMAASRSIAADAVLRKPPMKTSQYVDLDERGNTTLDPEEKKKKAAREHGVLNVVTIILLLAVYYVFFNDTGGLETSIWFLAVICVVIAAASAFGAYARKQLGGMNGDIAGYMIVMSETVGVLAAALLATVLAI